MSEVTANQGFRVISLISTPNWECCTKMNTGSRGFREKKKIQFYVSDWEQSQLQELADQQGTTISDLVRDGVKNILRYSESPIEYIEQWELLWVVRIEIERLMNFLALEVGLSTATDELIAYKAKIARDALNLLLAKMTELKSDRTRQPR